MLIQDMYNSVTKLCNIYNSLWDWRVLYKPPKHISVETMDPKIGLWCSLPDAWWKNLLGQQPGSNSSVRKLLLLISTASIHEKK